MDETLCNNDANATLLHGVFNNYKLLNIHIMKKSFLIFGLSTLILSTSCEKHESIDIDVQETPKNIVNDIPTLSSSKSAQGLDRESLTLMYDDALSAIEYIQSQDDFFNNGSMNSVKAYVESRFNNLANDSIQYTSMTQFANNLEYISGVAESNIELYRATVLGGNVDNIIADMEKEANEAPFRILQNVETSSSTIIDLVIAEWISVGNKKFQFEILGENTELLDAPQHKVHMTLNGNVYKYDTKKTVKIHNESADKWEVYTQFVGQTFYTQFAKNGVDILINTVDTDYIN